MPLVRDHIAGHPDGFRQCDPRWDLYAEFEADDAFAGWVVEDAGHLVGYAMLLKTPHMHSACTAFVIDALFVKPEFRGVGSVGVRLVDEVVGRAIEWAAQLGLTGKAPLVWAAPPEMAAWLGRKGFTVIDINYAKVI